MVFYIEFELIAPVFKHKKPLIEVVVRDSSIGNIVQRVRLASIRCIGSVAQKLLCIESQTIIFELRPGVSVLFFTSDQFSLFMMLSIKIAVHHCFSADREVF